MTIHCLVDPHALSNKFEHRVVKTTNASKINQTHGVVKFESQFGSTYNVFLPRCLLEFNSLHN